ncbi:MAG: hypothetical protein KDD82_18210, partial [Planctomycetes bacterium]|nr:hypothetical protein [Planctomycetota bacterium]
MKPTPEDALGKLAMAHLLGALEDTEAALFEACAAEHPETEAVLAEAREDLACVDAPPVAAPEGAWRKIQEQLRHKRAGTEPAQPLAPDDVILVSCSYCRDGLERASTVYCASCLAPHHPDCFREHGRCSVMGCGETQIVRAVGHRELEPPAPEKLAPRRSRWRRRAGLGVFVLVGGGLAAYSGDLAEVAVATGHREDPEAGLQEELWKRGVELGYRAGSSGSTAGTAPTRTPTQPLLRAEWRDATLGEVLTALREAGVPLELRGEGWADAEVADQALTEQGAGSLLGSLAEPLGLACVAEPSGWVLDARGAPPPPAAPKLRDGAGIYRVDALDPTRVTALDFAPADPAEVQVAAGSERWAIRSGGTLRVYEGARLLCELPQSREATGLALDARGERVAWVRGRTLCVCDPASEDALTGAVSERELPWPPSYMAPPQGPSEAILDYDRAGNLLVVCSRGGWVLGADGRAAADWAPIPALAFGPLLRGVAERGSAAVPAGGPRARLVPSAGSGWRVFVSDAEGLKALIYEVGVTREGPLALRGLGQNLSLPARGEVALDALADALRRRELGIGCERMDEEEASALAARGEAGRALVARAFGRWAVASVYRVTQEGQPGWALDLQRQGDRATLDLDAADGEVTHVLWQGAERLLVLQQSRHSVAVHTIACPSGPLSQAQVVHTLHAAVSGVLGAYALGEGQLALRLA